MPSNPAISQPTLVVVVFPKAKLLDVAGPMQVFADARHMGGEAYRTSLVSMRGGSVSTDTVATLETKPNTHWHGRSIDTLLIAGGAGAVPATADKAFLDSVATLAKSARRVASICTGASILAAAGLLDGRDAVTHWEYCAAFAATYPKVTVHPDRIFVRDGQIWTSAGVTAGIDMALAMVAEDSGRQVALRLARSLVAFMARPGGQSQFSEVLSRQHEDAAGRFDALHTWIASNLDRDLRIEALAEIAGMSPRNFSRVYLAETGQTPAKAVEALRVDAARRYLEDSDDPISVVARNTGFMDDERLRRAMQRILGLSPKDYRQRFGVAVTLETEPEENRITSG
ncbi:MAG: helix-turn-helix domain-containing protein [Pseudomonadota bacterium]